ncbi:deoxyguanosine kinase [gamma proteobacterium HTCC5015]|nr:deoxyguanosine kinase [gamma proteobacterium HTCC5015]
MSEMPKYIVVEGPIGAGKTSLAKRLAHSYGSELLLEAASENPFLEKFYQNPKQHALATQMFFLMQRAGQVQELRQSDLFEPVRVADFLIEKDRLFAELILDADELKLYQQMYRHLTLDMPPPDLVIYLQAPVDVLQQRIARRGIAMEQGMSNQYLQSLCDAYTKFFHDYQSSPLLVVNAESLNFVDVEQDYQWLLEQIPQVTSGRHYFNPEPIR